MGILCSAGYGSATAADAVHIGMLLGSERVAASCTLHIMGAVVVVLTHSFAVLSTSKDCGDIQITGRRSPGICRVIGIGHDLDQITGSYSDLSRIHNGIAVRPLGVTVSIGGQIVDSISPAQLVPVSILCIEADAQGAVCRGSPVQEIALAALLNACIIGHIRRQSSRIFLRTDREYHLDHKLHFLSAVIDQSPHIGSHHVISGAEDLLTVVDGHGHAVYSVSHAVEGSTGRYSNNCSIILIVQQITGQVTGVGLYAINLSATSANTLYEGVCLSA